MLLDWRELAAQPRTVSENAPRKGEPLADWVARVAIDTEGM